MDLEIIGEGEIKDSTWLLASLQLGEWLDHFLRYIEKSWEEIGLKGKILSLVSGFFSEKGL